MGREWTSSRLQQTKCSGTKIACNHADWQHKCHVLARRKPVSEGAMNQEFKEH
jgi:hypothetical protein